MTGNLELFVEIIAIAVALQTLMLIGVGIGVLVALRKVNAVVKHVTDEIQPRVLPLLDNSSAMLADVKSTIEVMRPKVDVILDNVAHVSTIARKDVERADATVNDMIDRARLQMIRADEMVTRTMDRVEETTEKVQHSVMTPVRHVSGLVQAVSTGVGTFFSKQKRRNGGPADEMFI